MQQIYNSKEGDTMKCGLWCARADVKYLEITTSSEMWFGCFNCHMAFCRCDIFAVLILFFMLCVSLGSGTRKWKGALRPNLAHLHHIDVNLWMSKNTAIRKVIFNLNIISFFLPLQYGIIHDTLIKYCPVNNLKLPITITSNKPIQ